MIWMKEFLNQMRKMKMTNNEKNKMKLYTIKITDADVYINGELQHFAMPMDKENHEDDLNKKE